MGAVHADQHGQGRNRGEEQEDASDDLAGQALTAGGARCGTHRKRRGKDFVEQCTRFLCVSRENI